MVAGLDTSLGMHRLLGKRRLYLDLLRGYAEGQRQSPQAIRDALARNDVATAERLAHTARGLSGNIGATRLAELAGALEARIREGAPPPAVEAALASYAESLGEMVTSLQAALPPRRWRGLRWQWTRSRPWKRSGCWQRCLASMTGRRP